MPDERRYSVTGAILTRKTSGTVWTLTFTPEPEPPGLPFDPDARKEIVVTLPPAQVDNMLFDATYTRSEIEALRNELSPE
jgi:hypothetical protein